MTRSQSFGCPGREASAVWPRSNCFFLTTLRCSRLISRAPHAPVKLRTFLLTDLVACSLIRAHAAEPPKLVVAILVDHLRYDYLERFHDQFSERGFRLLTEEGAFMTFAHCNYMPTITGPDHASFLSGSPPAVHGIISNDSFDKRTLKTMNCVSGPEVQGVGAEGTVGQRSPRNFIGSTFADEMRRLPPTYPPCVATHRAV